MLLCHETNLSLDRTAETSYIAPIISSVPPHQNDFFINVCTGVNHFNVSLIVRAQAQEGVHKPELLKKSLIEPNLGPSSYQPNALPLSQIGSPWGTMMNKHVYLYTLCVVIHVITGITIVTCVHVRSG